MASELDLDELVDFELKKGTFPGLVMLVEKEGKIVYALAKGFRQILPAKELMTMNTIFDLASLTKPLATALLILHTFFRENLDLDRKIAYFLPGISAAAAKITVRELLLHTACLPPVPDIYKEFSDPKDIDYEKAEKKLLACEPAEKPGSQVIYSCTGYLILSLILKKVTGRRLKTLFRGIAEQGRIPDLFFNPGSRYRKRIAPTEFCAWRKRWLRGEVHDENSYCMGGDGGNAGLFGTAESVLKILTIFTSDGFLEGINILPSSAIQMMTTCFTENLNSRRSMGFLMQGDDSPAGPLFSPLSFGHTGFTGTSVWIEPVKNFKVVILTNRVHFGRESTSTAIADFRKRVHSALYEYFTS
ncbi:MAG: serine hydrolase domain-containing protein [Spirochaetota bacterium]